ncbi:hypothetical protein C8F01DRAFT_1067449 [Mycena amicta]|nr:hypothetical protein C8F01DRAFT_1067449 [Mycena amicta]
MATKRPRIPNSVLEAAVDKGMLPLPGKDAHHSEQYPVNSLGQKALSNLCAQYGLPFSGNKTKLKAELEGLSERWVADPLQCLESMKPPKVRKHKGPRQEATIKTTNSSRKTGKTTIAARREQLMITNSTNPHAPSQRSKDMRTNTEARGILSWAARNVKRFPYQQPKPVVDENMPDQPVPPLPNQPMAVWMHGVAVQLEHMRSTLITNNGQQSSSSSLSIPAPLPSAASPSTSDARPPVAPSGLLTDISAYIASSSNASIVPQSASASVVPSQNVPAGAPSSQAPVVPFSTAPVVPPYDNDLITSSNAPVGAGRPRSFTIANQTIITFDLNTFRMPTINYSKHIDDLFGEWDDTHSSWKNTSPIVIDERPIALKYIHPMFINSGTWAAHKTKWNDWKHLVTAYHKTTPDAFWARFSTDKGRMSYTALMRALRDDRMQLARDIAQRARDEFGDTFEENFSYRKRGTDHVMTNEAIIAKHYLHLKPDSLPDVTLADIGMADVN